MRESGDWWSEAIALCLFLKCHAMLSWFLRVCIWQLHGVTDEHFERRMTFTASVC
jgi:hypothetical protein